VQMANHVDGPSELITLNSSRVIFQEDEQSNVLWMILSLMSTRLGGRPANALRPPNIVEFFFWSFAIRTPPQRAVPVRVVSGFRHSNRPG
jgi:hypothetical protein